MTEWFEDWFNTEEYLNVYRHRNEEDAKNLFDLIIKNVLLEKGSKVLDLACGAGRHSILFAKNNFDVTAVDPATIRLGREGVREMVTPIRWNNNKNDLWLKFDKSAAVSALMLGDVAGQEVQLFITGKLKDEFGKTPFMGAVVIGVVQ